MLGIRHFEEKYRNYYYLPKDIKFISSEIESVFSILKNYDEDKRRSYLNAKDYANSLLSFSKSQGREKGKKEGREEEKKKIF